MRSQSLRGATSPPRLVLFSPTHSYTFRSRCRPPRHPHASRDRPPGACRLYRKENRVVRPLQDPHGVSRSCRRSQRRAAIRRLHCPRPEWSTARHHKIGAGWLLQHHSHTLCFMLTAPPRAPARSRSTTGATPRKSHTLQRTGEEPGGRARSAGPQRFTSHERTIGSCRAAKA